MSQHYHTTRQSPSPPHPPPFPPPHQQYPPGSYPPSNNFYDRNPDDSQPRSTYNQPPQSAPYNPSSYPPPHPSYSSNQPPSYPPPPQPPLADPSIPPNYYGPTQPPPTSVYAPPPAPLPAAPVSDLGLHSLSDGPPGQKPPYPYSTIIRCAILGSPRQRLTLSELYEHVESRFPWFKNAGSGWKNSVRHNLSLNKCFEKVARPITEPGKGSYWTVNLSAGEGNKRVRKRKPRNKAAKIGAPDTNHTPTSSSGSQGRSQPDEHPPAIQPGSPVSERSMSHAGSEGSVSPQLQPARVGSWPATSPATFAASGASNGYPAQSQAGPSPQPMQNNHHHPRHSPDQPPPQQLPPTTSQPQSSMPTTHPQSFASLAGVRPATAPTGFPSYPTQPAFGQPSLPGGPVGPARGFGAASAPSGAPAGPSSRGFMPSTPSPPQQQQQQQQNPSSQSHHHGGQSHHLPSTINGQNVNTQRGTRSPNMFSQYANGGHPTQGTPRSDSSHSSSQKSWPE